MIINKTILHIFDSNSDIYVLSQRGLDISNNAINSYIEKHLDHIQLDANQKLGAFLPDTSFLVQLNRYLKQQSDFIEWSFFVGKTLFEQLLRSDKSESTDLLIADFSNSNIRYLALLLLSSKKSYTHQVLNNNGEIHNEIVLHNSILPNITQKIDSYALIRCDNLTVGFSDIKRTVDGKETYLIPEILLQCTSTISSREAIKTVSKIAIEVAEKNGLNSAVILSKAKNFFLENAEISSTFSPVELGQDLFEGSEDMQKEFEIQINKAQLPNDVKVDKGFAIRIGKKHKIKTDTGIEITFPAEYFDNHDYIEFVNNPDGTISIEVKNIGKILNK
ncbi:hypothetical protein SDC9_87102 [bioreactor metagenome]|uniref:Nucleoid-associated protein YejK n=1 Tax=bioreactor metagenome TaxID=1076179 RepID=A0A644ZJF1_9ZZZZ